MQAGGGVRHTRELLAALLAWIGARGHARDHSLITDLEALLDEFGRGG